jgi:hypothetical protein
MVIVCAWCRTQVGVHSREDGRTSHTVCDRCLGGLMRSDALARETTVRTPPGGGAQDLPTNRQ